MALAVVNPFASVAEYKDFIRVSGASLDAYYGTLLAMITARIQEYTQQALVYQSSIFEFANPRGQDYIVVKERPLLSITNLWFDPTGIWGQGTDAFASGTLQVVGSDYAIKYDKYSSNADVLHYSRSGLVYLFRGQGAGRGVRSRDRLTPELQSALGTIKIQYAAGFPDAIFPPDLKLATMQLTRALEMTARNAGWALQSESTKYYNYSLGELLNRELHAREILSTYVGLGLSAV